MTTLEVLFTPADFEALNGRDLQQTTCVVFDILRATTSMITALENGAAAIVPVGEIAEALALRSSHPGALLAGERDGLRIRAAQTGSVDFDLGNSPREFTADRVRERTILMTTTNGTRALRSCAGAQRVLPACFRNLGATAELLLQEPPSNLLIICSGTFEQMAYEDVLAAGALCELVWPRYQNGLVSDAALIARRLFQPEAADLPAALGRARNGRRLLSRAELAEDVAFCAQSNAASLVASQDPEGVVRRLR
jgi:2-phosphosulfolactate phosphatase